MEHDVPHGSNRRRVRYVPFDWRSPRNRRAGRRPHSSVVMLFSKPEFFSSGSTFARHFHRGLHACIISGYYHPPRTLVVDTRALHFLVMRSCCGVGSCIIFLRHIPPPPPPPPPSRHKLSRAAIAPKSTATRSASSACRKRRESLS